MMMIRSRSVKNCIWSCQTNTNPYDLNESAKWTDYPKDISKAIELAYQNNIAEIIIRTGYRIDLKVNLQIHGIDSTRQRPIRRRCLDEDDLTLPVVSISESKALRLEERYGFPLESDSADVDTHYQGSLFIVTWLQKISKDRPEVTCDQVFHLLIQGIGKEANENPKTGTRKLLDSLHTVASQYSTCGNKKRLEMLSEACVTLYSGNSFLYQIVNKILRDNNLEKMETLGPFCYLLYDYIGRQSVHNRFLLSHFRQMLDRRRIKSLLVYRGDKISEDKLRQYSEAAGDMKRSFKWLCFVSTSKDQDVARRFAKNVFYEIDLGRYKSNDQFADIVKIAVFPDEQEVLLRPGVRFRVDKLQSDPRTHLTHVHIHVLPSYISTL